MASISKTEMKNQARVNLLHGLNIAFYGDNVDAEMFEVMSSEMERIEKLFGYVPGSSWRGN